MRDFFYTAKILSTYGVNGYLKLKPFSDNLDHLKGLKVLQLEQNSRIREYEVEELKKYSGIYLIKFSGINSPEDAVLLTGALIRIPREKAPKLKKNEVYISDLTGMKLIYENEEVGTVVSTVEGAQSYLLEVECLDGKLRFVPFMRDIFVTDVDVTEGKMRLLRRDLV